MRWDVGTDHIHRATLGNVRAEISMCSGRSSWRVRVFNAGEMIFDQSPYFQMRRARKSAENIMERNLEERMA
jgi:hypothetical protein